MSTLPKTEFYVPEDGIVVLPEEYRGGSVFIQKIMTSTNTSGDKSAVQELLDFCTKDPSTLTDEDVDQIRYEYLSEKYR